MNRPKGAVSAGHEETAKAASEILRAGGNAFDAVVAAHLTACVAEPVLSSLGGGGFLLAKTSNNNEVVYDFFAQTPIRKREASEISFFPISGDFGTATQEFHIGAGSIATPGTVKGLCSIHKDLCTMPLERLAEPAISLAINGVVLNKFQAEVLRIIKPIYTAYPDVKKLFASRLIQDEIMQSGELLQPDDLAETIIQFAKEGERFFYEGDFAEKAEKLCRENGGHLALEDLKHYSVVKRKPLVRTYKNFRVSINPPPGSGGLMILFALGLMESMDKDFSQTNGLHCLAEVQAATEMARLNSINRQTDLPFNDEILGSDFLQMYEEKIKYRMKAARGTTHISIVDGEGNMASLTTSNGEGSGLMVPGTGVILNNMLGEEDLNPEGFHAWKPNQRMTSMMAPCLLHLPDGTNIVMGSGGSNRIRTAILQVIINLVDHKMSLEEAIVSPRIHHENGLLNIEHGFDERTINKLISIYKDYKIWSDKSLFFGGVNAVSINDQGFEGFGDPRRGGVCMVVNQGAINRTI